MYNENKSDSQNLSSSEDQIRAFWRKAVDKFDLESAFHEIAELYEEETGFFVNIEKKPEASDASDAQESQGLDLQNDKDWAHLSDGKIKEENNDISETYIG
jgi:accessory colonization factor AcfC